ncbi:MAG: hypothetical protein ACOZAK_00185 [Patescibacteria group bacterium]
MKRQSAEIWTTDIQAHFGHSTISSFINNRLSDGRNHGEQPTGFERSRKESMSQAKTLGTTKRKSPRKAACNIQVRLLVQLSAVIAISTTTLFGAAVNLDTKFVKRQSAEIWTTDIQAHFGHSTISSFINNRLQSSTLRPV